MPSSTVPAQALQANVEFLSPAILLAASVNTVTVQLTGSTWFATAGKITKWGLKRSTDGGANFSWWLWQTGVKFGSGDKAASALPSLMAQNHDRAIGAASDQFKFSITVDTAITMGATSSLT